MLIWPGEIYLLKQEKPRPIIVVSREELKRGASVVAVPLTTAHLEKRAAALNCVRLDAGDFGLDRDCVAQAEQLGITQKIYLDLDVGPIGKLDDETREELIRTIGYVMGSSCARNTIDP